MYHGLRLHLCIVDISQDIFLETFFLRFLSFSLCILQGKKGKEKKKRKKKTVWNNIFQNVSLNGWPFPMMLWNDGNMGQNGKSYTFHGLLRKIDFSPTFKVACNCIPELKKMFWIT